MKYEEVFFLRESNNIEGVHDDLSLQQAIFAWQFVKSKKELNRSVVLKTHKILMLHQNLMPNEKGYLRKVPVYVGGREGLKANELPKAVDNWCELMNMATIVQPPEGQFFPNKREIQIEDAKRLHVQYEIIHPFVDGNGRTGRIFLNWLLYRLRVPLLVLEERYKKDYYAWFH